MPASSWSRRAATGKFRFNLLSTNGQVVATSEAYNSNAAAMNGVRTVKRLAVDAAIEDQTTKEWAADETARKAARPAKNAAKKTSGAAGKT